MTKASTVDFDELEWLVWQSANRLDRSGVYPSGDRLCLGLEDWPERAVRRTRANLAAWGFLTPATPNDRPDHPEPDPSDAVDSDGDDDEPLTLSHYGHGGDAIGNRSSASRKDVNVALWRIVHGKGPLYKALATVTGLTPNAVKCRVNHAEYSYPSDELDPGATALSHNDRQVIEKLMRLHEGDASVREWKRDVYAPLRGRPDKRSSARDRPARRSPAA